MASHWCRGPMAGVSLGTSRFQMLWRRHILTERPPRLGQLQNTQSTKYCDILHGYEFVSVDVETLGAWNDNALFFIKQLGRRLTDATGEQLETAYLLLRLSVSIQRYNAICFLAVSSCMGSAT